MKRSSAAIWIVLLLPLVRLFGEIPEAERAGMRRHAMHLFRDSQYEQSLALYRDLAADEPSSLEAQKDLMWALWNSGRYDQAGEEAARILAQHPGDAEARQILNRAPLTANRDKLLELRRQAVASARAGDYAAATKAYQEIALIDSGNYRLLKDLMWVQVRANDQEGAQATAQRLLSLRPGDPEALSVLQRTLGLGETPSGPVSGIRLKSALAKVKEGQFNTAIDHLTKLTQDEPGNADAWRYLTATCHQAGRFEEGLKAAEQWTALKPQDPQSWSWRAVLLLDLGQTDLALRSYQKSLDLKPDQPKVDMAIGRIYVGDREFETALPYLTKARTADPRLAEVYPLLAKTYFWTRQYAESAASWKSAVALFPSRTEYRFNEAQALFYAGDQKAALAKMKALSAEPGQHAALLFVVDQSISRSDIEGAESILEQHLQTLEIPDEALVTKLADLYQSQGKWDRMLSLLDRYLALSPNNQRILFMKGTVYYEQKNFSACVTLHEKLVSLNPNDVDAIEMLSVCERSLGRRAASRRYNERLLELDPTNPDYILLDALERYDDGYAAKAKRAVRSWIEHNNGHSTLAVLLYHGLTPYANDPVLAYPYHSSVAMFEDQLKALKAAGYSSVTTEQVAQWYRGEAELPDLPVLITFDDGRLDSLYYADPILKKLAWRATMFAVIINIEGHRPPGFAPWRRLAASARSGRWEIGSHGDRAHIRIPIDEQGDRGLFLVNRQWLEADKRLETPEQWRQRIAQDYRSSSEKIFEHIGSTPTAYSFPEGAYGQQGIVNVPDAAPVNLELAAKSYALAFSQNRTGMNPRSRDPYHLRRMEPSNTWSGEFLLRYLRDKDPRVPMTSAMLDWSAWEGRFREAYGYLDELKRLQVSKGLLLAKEAEIHYAMEDEPGGRALAEQALAFGDFPDLRTTMARSRAEDGWSWSPSIVYENDSSDRNNLVFEQVLRTRRYGAFRWGLIQQWGQYREADTPSVTENGLGLEGQIFLGHYHRLTLTGVGQTLSGEAENMFAAGASLESRLTDSLKTRLDGGQRFVPTASAMNAHIRDRYALGRVELEMNEYWRSSIDGRLSSYTDGNNRTMLQPEISRLVWEPINLRMVFQYTYDNTREVEPQYYCPQNLRKYGFGPDFGYRWNPHVRWTGRYFPAYSTEDGASSMWVHDAETRLELTWGRWDLQPSYAYYKTSNYWDQLYRLDVSYRF